MQLILRALAASCFVVCLVLVACQKGDPVIPNPEELITTLNLTLIPGGGGGAAELTFFDPDGDGGAAPEISIDTLTANTTYTGQITLRNDTEIPAKNIREEVEQEAEDHQFFYEISQASATISYNDMDANGDPLGLRIVLTTGQVSQGLLTIVLRHEPDKRAPGVSDGVLENAGGETDIEVTFDLVIQ